MSYTLYNGGHVAVGAAVVEPVPQNLTIPLEVEGPSGRFSVTPPGITIPAGETAGSVLLEDISLQEGDRILLSLNPPKGYAGGRRSSTTVVYDPREALYCTIPGSEYSFTEGMEMTVVITGVRSGASYVAEDRLLIPAYISGDGSVSDGSAEVAFKEGGFIVEKGSNIGKGTLIRTHTNDIERPLSARIGIVDFDDSRILSGGQDILLHIPKTEK